MKYSPDEIMQYIEEEDVKFIRLAFTDIYGKQKNISVMPDELEKAFHYGIAIDPSAIPGFGCDVHSDLLLHPDPSTIAVLPWRPDHGRVVRMFCSITRLDGTPFGSDTRAILKKAIADAKKEGVSFAPKWNFIFLPATRKGNRQKSPMTVPVTWTLLPTTREKTFAARFA